MALYMNNANVKSVYWNGTKAKKVYFNNVLVLSGGKFAFTYTGAYAVEGDLGGDFVIRFKTSGTLTITDAGNAASLDAFLVGGGGGGMVGTNSNKIGTGIAFGAGGGGGYTATHSSIMITTDTAYTIAVGAGGAGGTSSTDATAGGQTTAFEKRLMAEVQVSNIQTRLTRCINTRMEEMAGLVGAMAVRIHILLVEMAELTEGMVQGHTLEKAKGQRQKNLESGNCILLAETEQDLMFLLVQPQLIIQEMAAVVVATLKTLYYLVLPAVQAAVALYASAITDEKKGAKSNGIRSGKPQSGIQLRTGGKRRCGQYYLAGSGE